METGGVKNETDKMKSSGWKYDIDRKEMCGNENFTDSRNCSWDLIIFKSDLFSNRY